jgi:glycosyltransferase involved in cell wall biosynthesis
MLFEILIPTMPGREHFLERLLAHLESQMRPGVMISLDAGPGSIGRKRQRMLENAKAEYVAFVDDDDMVSDDYIPRVLACLETRPDVVGMVVHVTMDGRDYHPSPLFEHSLRHRLNRSWSGQVRTPHHLCPMRRELALRARFPDLMWAEDYNWALGVLEHLQTEEWPGAEPLYFYEYVSGKGPNGSHVQEVLKS